jgi:hypothetical protein
MGNKADLRRRSLGAGFLLVALGMLIVGQTLLHDSLTELGFLVYWLCCFAFTFLAIAVAFWDLAAVRRRTREEHRALIESTLKDIQNEKARKAGRPPGATDAG